MSSASVKMPRQKFWDKIKKSLDKSSDFGAGGCIMWTGATDRHGYGRKQVTWPDSNKSEMRVHRLSFMMNKNLMYWEIASHDDNGQPLDVSHRCHNKLCINSAHLVLEARDINNDRNHCMHLNRCTGNHDPHCLLPRP